MRNGRFENWGIKNCNHFLAHCGLVLVFLLLMPSFAAEQRKKKVMTGSAAKIGAPANLRVAADLSQRLARFRRVQITFPAAGLSAREQQLVHKLVEACGYLESIYWRQSDPEGLTLYQSLASARNRRDVQLRRYLWINASRFDLLDQNKPFVGTETKHLRPFPTGLHSVLFWSLLPKLYGRLPSSVMMRRSRSFFSCGPMRCSATITLLATSRGWS